MKNLIKIILFILFVNYSIVTVAQGQKTTNDPPELTLVRKQFSEINRHLKGFRKVIKTDTAQSTEGNEITLFYEGLKIKKIQAIYYGETGKAVNEYYFFDGKLIFYYSAVYRYDKPINVGDGKVKIASTNQKRYYFNHDKIFLVKLSSNQNVSSDHFLNLSAQTEREAQRLLKIQ